MRAAQIPTKFPIPFANNAQPVDINPIPQASQIGITGGAASLTDGFPPLNFLPVGAGGIPPWGRDFNGLFNQITAWTQFAECAGGQVFYDASFSNAIGGYPQGAMLLSSNLLDFSVIWISTIDNNTQNPDTTFGGSGAWLAVGFVTNIQNESYISADDTGTVSNQIIFAPQPPPLAYQKYQRYQIKIANVTTGSALGSVTANMFGLSASGTGPTLLGARNVVYADGSPPSPLMFNVGEIAMLVYDGTQFQVENRVPTLVIPIGSPIIYVRPDGNDTNSGLVNSPAGAMQHVQAALTRANNIYALQGKVLTIQLGIPGTYTPFFVPPTTGQIIIQGDVTSRGSYIFAGAPGDAEAFIDVVGSNVTLQGFTCNCTTTNVNIIGCSFGGSININQVVLNQSSGANAFSALLVSPGGTIDVIGPIAISGTLATAINCSQGAFTCVSPITLVNTPSFTTATAVAAYSGGTVNFSNAGAVVGASNGPRYSAFLNGVINTNGGGANFFPGTSAGTTTSGGQYA